MTNENDDLSDLEEYEPEDGVFVGEPDVENDEENKQ